MLLAIHWGPDPIITNIGSFALRWYSLLFATGFIIGFFILRKKFLEEKVSLDVLDKMLLYSVVGTILGARIGNCVFYEWEYFSQHLLEIILPFKWDPEFHFTGYRGLASHGALLGLLIAYALLAWRTGKNMLWFLDKGALIGGLCLGSIRLGNLMNSEILGAPFDGPWAFVFTRLQGEAGQIARHPVQIYGFITYLALFFFMLWYYKRQQGKVKDGHFFGIFLAVLGTLRLSMEFLKKHYVFSDESLLNMAQYLSLPMIIIGIVIFFLTKGTNHEQQTTN